MHASRERRAQSMYVKFCFGKGLRRKPEPGHGSLGSQARATLLMSPQGHAMIWCWSLARWGAWLPARCWMSRLLICRLDSKMGRAADITDQVRIHNPWQSLSYAGSLVEACSFGALLRHPVSTFAFEPTIEYFAHVKKERDWSWIVRVKRKMETNKTDDHLCLSWCCVFRIADFICVFDVFAYDGLFIICIYIHYVYPVLNMLEGLRMWCVDICDMRIPCFLCPCPPLYTLGIWRLVLCSLSPLTVGSLDFRGFVSLLTFGWARVYKFH